MKGFIAGLVIALSVWSGTARAQSTGSGLFVSGTVFDTIELGGISGDFSSPAPIVGTITGDTDFSDSVLAGGFDVGAWLAPRVTVRLEAAFLGSRDLDYTRSSDGFSVLSIYLSGSSGLIVPAPTILTRYQTEVSTATVSVLAGYHPLARGRVRIGLLAGLAIQRERTETRVSSTLPYTSQSVTSVLYPIGAALGADGDIRWTNRLSIVPQLRVVAFGDDVSIRPGVAVRWTF